MHFGENQLSRSLIGLSPLTTGHPPGFQPWWVRSSTKSYLRFNLPMARSLRFGSRACNSIALFGLAFATASPHGLTSLHTANSQAHSSKGTQSRLYVQAHTATLPCGHPQLTEQVRSPVMAPLLPKLRGHFAEFLNHSSPERLGILYLTT